MNKRDLKADLELCNRATPGPWIETDESNLEVFVENTWGDPVLYEIQYDGPHTAIRREDMEFLIEAREGWPHAIERAIKAEEIVQDLTRVLRLYEKWEMDLEADHALWQSASGLPFITQKYWDEILVIRDERNRVLKNE